MNSLVIKNLSLTYKNGVQAINDISLTIENGMFGLLGPNGAGKSSLMKTLVGLQKPDSGSISFNGVDVLENPLCLQKHLGFLPQDFGVYPKTTAIQLLHHLAILKGIKDKKEREDQIFSLLDRVNLSHCKDKEVHTFSGGMKQRFGVAQALLGNPKIVIVDEPTAGLDPEERNRFNNVLNELSEDIIIILSTHLVEDVRNLCSEMAIIRDGKIISKGNPDDQVAILRQKIWQKTVHKSELDYYQRNFQVLSNRLIERKLVVTLFNEEFIEGFTEVYPSLEDYYFYSLNNFSS